MRSLLQSHSSANQTPSGPQRGERHISASPSPLRTRPSGRELPRSDGALPASSAQSSPGSSDRRSLSPRPLDRAGSRPPGAAHHAPRSAQRPPGPPPPSLCRGRRCPPSPAAPGRETHRRGRRGGGTRLWEPRSGTSGRGCAGRERDVAEGGAVEARGQRGAAWTRGPGLRPGARAPPSAPARPDGARGRGIAPGRLSYALVSEEPLREASAQRGLPLVPRDGWRGIYK